MTTLIALKLQKWLHTLVFKWKNDPTWGELLIISSMKFLRLPLGVWISPTDSRPSKALSSDRQLTSMALWDPLDTLRAPLTCWLQVDWAWSGSSTPITGADSRLRRSLSFTSPPPADGGAVLLTCCAAGGCSLAFGSLSLSRLSAKEADPSGHTHRDGF